MTDHTPSGQQAVEHCPKCGSVVEDAAGIGPFCPNPKCDVADNLLCVPTFNTAAPTAPSTAAGEREAFTIVDGANSHIFDYRVMRGEECVAFADYDFAKRIAAALATPPAHVVEKENLDHAKQFLEAQGFQVFSTGPLPLPTTPPAPSVPWEERAAQIRREAIEKAAQQADAWGFGLVGHRIRALLSKPAKGEGN